MLCGFVLLGMTMMLVTLWIIRGQRDNMCEIRGVNSIWDIPRSSNASAEKSWNQYLSL